MRKIPHNVLNAKQHQREADIVAQAGLSWTNYYCNQYGWSWYGY
jgi:preprotein translocase subunit SecA